MLSIKNTNMPFKNELLRSKKLSILTPIQPRYRLTRLGEQMAHLPIDPKIARILLVLFHF
ncbi:hypothetical protein CYJ98_009995 [Neisseria perflava]|jgi:ATP-dependent RNA helicase hrpA|uniref:Uncharacterized protein n=1 Tax=Neisseria perflava TaxID=33053 RepID=A0AAF1BWU4_NEIPE|nr:hypothetical protein [Neisseria perflava]WOS97881.1 hypothetical protein CYJ98_009995 [Neisseria perflava]